MWSMSISVISDEKIDSGMSGTPGFTAEDALRPPGGYSIHEKMVTGTKITLLFTVALTLMATLSCLIVFFCQPPGHQKTVRDNLIEKSEM